MTAGDLAMTGTLAKPMGPAVPAEGQQLDMRGIHVLHARGSRIMATEDYWDGMTFQAQMSTTSRGDA
jgi:ketosteroid isomerase-like protein